MFIYGFPLFLSVLYLFLFFVLCFYSDQLHPCPNYLVPKLFSHYDFSLVPRNFPSILEMLTKHSPGSAKREGQWLLLSSTSWTGKELLPSTLQKNKAASMLILKKVQGTYSS